MSERVFNIERRLESRVAMHPANGAKSGDTDCPVTVTLLSMPRSGISILFLYYKLYNSL